MTKPSTMVASKIETPTSASSGLIFKFSRTVLSKLGCTSPPVGVDNFNGVGDAAVPSGERRSGSRDDRSPASGTPFSAEEEGEGQLMLFREKLAASRTSNERARGFDPSQPRSGLSPGLEELTLSPSRSNEPLHKAVATGKSEEVARVLAGNTSDVNASSKGHSTALHTAVQSGGQDIVRLLLDKSADVRAPDKNGWTPLHHAALQGHAGVVEQLLGAGSTVDCVTEEGMTPLHCTVHVRNCMQAEESTPCMKNVMRLLIESGADVNAKDYQGWTPLHVAVQSGSIELVRELMALGADVGARDREGNLPVDYTPVSRGLYHQNRDMQRLLRSEMEGSSRSQTPDNAADCGCVGGESAGSTPQSTPAPIHTTLLHDTPIG